jgi:hypothetical protein
MVLTALSGQRCKVSIKDRRLDVRRRQGPEGHCRDWSAAPLLTNTYQTNLLTHQ